MQIWEIMAFTGPFNVDILRESLELCSRVYEWTLRTHAQTAQH